MRFLLLLPLSFFLSACPPSLPRWTPPANPSEHIRWFRTTFYQTYQLEAQTRDGADRLRHLIRSFPPLARQTHQANLQAILLRKEKRLPFRNLEHFYLLMNLLIEESLPSP